MLNSLGGRTVASPNREKVENLNSSIIQKLENIEKISFFENMISENLSPKGKDMKMTMKMIITSTSTSVVKKVDRILDFFENVDLYLFL